MSDLALMPALMGRLREQPATQIGNVVVAASDRPLRTGSQLPLDAASPLHDRAV